MQSRLEPALKKFAFALFMGFGEWRLLNRGGFLLGNHRASFRFRPIKMVGRISQGVRVRGACPQVFHL